MNSKVLLIGAFHEIIELIESDNNLSIEGLVDASMKQYGYYLGYEIIGNDDFLISNKSKYTKFPLIITPDQPLVRENLYRVLVKNYFKFNTLISSKSNISQTAEIGKGSIIQIGSNISSSSKIGCFVKLNSYANIMHDVKIDDFTTIAPNTVVLGNVRIGKRCYLGANSTVLPNLNICNDVTIGAGSVVTKNILESGVYYGNPVRKYS